MPERFSSPESGRPSEEKETAPASATEQKLADIERAEPEADWAVYVPEREFGVVIELPHGCVVSATLFRADNDEREGYIDIFSVPDELQGKGIGVRLLKSLAAELKKYGGVRVRGHVTSISALKTRAKAYGKENLVFYDRGNGARLPLNFEQALASGPVSYVVESDVRES